MKNFNLLILKLLAVIALLTGLYIFFMPESFYALTPGLDLMGPFSVHFIKDVGLAFLASGGAILYGAVKGNKAVVISGISWIFLHALFHVQIWGMRGFPFDFIFFFDLGAVILPAFIGLWAALKMTVES